MELVDENKELRDLNLKHQREIASLQKLLQNLPAAKTERSGPRQNDPIRHDVYPQANTDKSARNGARSNARPLMPTIPSPMTLAPNRHHDAYPQADKAARNGARSNAISMAIPVPSTGAQAPKPNIRKSYSGPAAAPIIDTNTAIRRSPASAVPAKLPDDRIRTDSEIAALIASVTNLKSS
ncbi:g14 [Coccomyxa elongata]